MSFYHPCDSLTRNSGWPHYSLCRTEHFSVRVGDDAFSVIQCPNPIPTTVEYLCSSRQSHFKSAPGTFDPTREQLELVSITSLVMFVLSSIATLASSAPRRSKKYTIPLALSGWGGGGAEIPRGAREQGRGGLFDIRPGKDQKIGLLCSCAARARRSVTRRHAGFPTHASGWLRTALTDAWCVTGVSMTHSPAQPRSISLFFASWDHRDIW